MFANGSWGSAHVNPELKKEIMDSITHMSHIEFDERLKTQFPHACMNGKFDLDLLSINEFKELVNGMQLPEPLKGLLVVNATEYGNSKGVAKTAEFYLSLTEHQ